MLMSVRRFLELLSVCAASSLSNVVASQQGAYPQLAESRWAIRDDGTIACDPGQARMVYAYLAQLERVMQGHWESMADVACVLSFLQGAPAPFDPSGAARRMGLPVSARSVVDGMMGLWANKDESPELADAKRHLAVSAYSRSGLVTCTLGALWPAMTKDESKASVRDRVFARRLKSVLRSGGLADRGMEKHDDIDLRPPAEGFLFSVRPHEGNLVDLVLHSFRVGAGLWHDAASVYRWSEGRPDYLHAAQRDLEAMDIACWLAFIRCGAHHCERVRAVRSEAGGVRITAWLIHDKERLAAVADALGASRGSDGVGTVWMHGKTAVELIDQSPRDDAGETVDLSTTSGDADNDVIAVGPVGEFRGFRVRVNQDGKIAITAWWRDSEIRDQWRKRLTELPMTMRQKWKGHPLWERWIVDVERSLQILVVTVVGDDGLTVTATPTEVEVCLKSILAVCSSDD